jgi:hypothetical protein
VAEGREEEEREERGSGKNCGRGGGSVTPRQLCKKWLGFRTLPHGLASYSAAIKAA